MARSRNDLSAMLHSICDNVYFQPPTGTMLTYPCIVYSRDNMQIRRADNRSYNMHDEYEIIYMTLDPDDINRDLIAELPMCSLTRSNPIDNLYHHYYRIFM